MKILKNIACISLCVSMTFFSAVVLAESASEHAAHQAKLNEDRAEAEIRKYEKKAAMDAQREGVISPEVRDDEKHIAEAQRKLNEAQEALEVAEATRE